MKHSSFLFSITACTLLFFTACKKDLVEELASKPSVPVEAADTAKAVVPTPTLFKRTVDVGTGSGNLVIDGSTFGFQCNDLVKIKAGSYKGIDIKNIISADGCPITIKNDGLVEIVGNGSQLNLSNLKNVTISGDGTTGLDKGFSLRDNSYRSVEMTGTINQFTMQYFSFKNIVNNVITFQYKVAYDGTDATTSKDLKFLHITCDNTSQLLSGAGSVENGNISGYVKNIEIAYVDFQNSPGVGTVVYLANVENYDVHNNKINNINSATNIHNGIFMLGGNGKFHDNIVSNHQGNAIRAWGHTVGSTPKNVYIYNNIVFNSRKYSAFELQSFESCIVKGKTTYVNAIVFNNTAGNLNTSNDWQGNLVDVYNMLGGKADVYNNLTYQFQKGNTVAGQEASTVPNSYNNLYYNTSGDAGLVNTTTFKLTSNSPAKNKGVASPFSISDYYGSARSAATPSIGAVE
jgi:hypothetical protein